VFTTIYPNFEVIVVDDGSTDGSVEAIEDIFGQDSRLTILRIGKNLGAAIARNIGVEASRGDILAFLDNDMEVKQGWLTELVNVLLSDQNIAIVSPKIYEYKSKQLIIGHDISLLTGRVTVQFYKKSNKNDQIIDAKMVGSDCQLIKKEIFKRVGRFDEAFLIPYEDSDLCLKVKRAGYRIVCVPYVTILHKGGASSVTIRRVFFMLRNKIIFMRKNAKSRNFLVFLVLFLPLYALYYSMKLLRLTRKPCVFRVMLRSISSGLSTPLAS
jgi:GT2 family glycosyltransferase